MRSRRHCSDPEKERIVSLVNVFVHLWDFQRTKILVSGTHLVYEDCVKTVIGHFCAIPTILNGSVMSASLDQVRHAS